MENDENSIFLPQSDLGNGRRSAVLPVASSRQSSNADFLPQRDLGNGFRSAALLLHHASHPTRVILDLDERCAGRGFGLRSITLPHHASHPMRVILDIDEN